MLSQFFWFTLLLNPAELPKEQVVPIEKDHQVLQLPIWNYATLPKKGEKLKVSLFQDNQKTVISGYLREIHEDPLGPTGTKGIIEIPQKYLTVLKSARGPWQIYPPMDQVSSRRKVYEVIF
ncbi:MAG: hypothetical protein K9K67_08700 [Bacteriovoracaceae bacterium]|nr:hypothetical protein [Bacteriovoracaceae bacterium]